MPGYHVGVIVPDVPNHRTFDFFDLLGLNPFERRTRLEALYAADVIINMGQNDPTIWDLHGACYTMEHVMLVRAFLGNVAVSPDDLDQRWAQIAHYGQWNWTSTWNPQQLEDGALGGPLPSYLDHRPVRVRPPPFWPAPVDAIMPVEAMQVRLVASSPRFPFAHTDSGLAPLAWSSILSILNGRVGKQEMARWQDCSGFLKDMECREGHHGDYQGMRAWDFLGGLLGSGVWRLGLAFYHQGASSPGDA